MKVKCPHCKYRWETKSKLVMTSCPSCQRKINIKGNSIKQMEVKNETKREGCKNLDDVE